METQAVSEFVNFLGVVLNPTTFWQGKRNTSSKMGLIDQTTSGTGLRGELGDARQGRDGGWPTQTGEETI